MRDTRQKTPSACLVPHSNAANSRQQNLSEFMHTHKMVCPTRLPSCAASVSGGLATAVTASSSTAVTHAISLFLALRLVFALARAGRVGLAATCHLCARPVLHGTRRKHKLCCTPCPLHTHTHTHTVGIDVSHP